MQRTKKVPSFVAQEAVLRGVIVDLSVVGALRVQDALDAQLIVDCDHLRATAGAPPQYQVGDQVLYVVPAGSVRGCVMGIVEPYQPACDALAQTLQKIGRQPSKTTVHDEVVHIKADKGLVIECGEGTIIITQDGKLQIKGKEITSRARGMHKIKGAGINLN
ncbi:MAG: hypothetical protein AABY83_15065 [Pseudomonadota bacterium]